MDCLTPYGRRQTFDRQIAWHLPGTYLLPANLWRYSGQPQGVR